ncbi:MAG: response regulator [Vicinamibacterales bacterium]
MPVPRTFTRSIAPATQRRLTRRRAARSARAGAFGAEAPAATPVQAENDAPRPEPDEQPAPQPPLVVATADPSLMRMLTFALDQHHLTYVAYTSGSAVLDALLSMPKAGPPAVVLLDVDLPGVDGHAILERLGVERPDSYLMVVLSSHADESTQVRSLLAGALDHLAKPFNVRVLMAKLRRWTAIARRCEAPRC